MLAAVVLALVSLGLINRLVYGPEGQVRAYFAAVREGNGAHALGILGAQIPDANAAMLDGAALKSSMAEVRHLTTSSVAFADGGERATVTVSYTLAGQPQTTDFQLHRVGSHWGVFDRWQIDSGPLPTVHLTSNAVEAATLNSTKVPVNQGERSFAVLYPGRYTVTFESALYSAGSQSVDVTGPGGQVAELEIALEPSETARISVQQQVRTYLDTCATQNSLYPAGCPFEYPFSGRVLGDVTWSVVTYPEPEVSVVAGRWSLGQGQGVAEVSLTELDLLTGATRQVTEEIPFTLTGSLAVSGEELVLKPSS